MRNLNPSWMLLPTGLVSFGLLGCGQQDPGDVAREKVVLATDQVIDAYNSPTSVEDADRYYTINQSREGVTVPADYSVAAFEQDRLNAMVPGLEAAANGASPLQQYTVARTLASIYRQDAHYLAGRASDSYDPIRRRLIVNLDFAQQMKRVNQQIAELQANRQQIIETLQTGEMGPGVNLQDFVTRMRRDEWKGKVQLSPVVRLEDYEDPIQYPPIQGVNAIEAREADLEEQIDQTRNELIAYLDEIEALLKSAAKNRQLSQELVAEASELTGQPRYDKLDQAIRVDYQGLSEQTQAETQIVLARVKFTRIGLTLGDMIDDLVVDAVFTALNRAGNVPSAADSDTFRVQMPQAVIAFGRAPANVKSSGFAEYQALLAQNPDDEQAAQAPAAQRAFFDQQVQAGVDFANQYLVIERGSDVAGSLAALRAVLDASKTPGDLASLRETIAQIEGRIATIREEQNRAQADLQKAERLRSELIGGSEDFTGFMPTLAEIEAQMRVLVVNQYEKAIEANIKAEAVLTAATPTSALQSAHEVDVLSTYLQHVRIQHDYLITLQTYHTLLQSYIAKDSDGNVTGGEILTDPVLEKLQELSQGIDEKIAGIRSEASTQGQSFRNTVQSYLDKAGAAAGSSTPEAGQIESLSENLDQLWRGMTGGSTPEPQPEPADSGEPEELTP